MKYSIVNGAEKMNLAEVMALLKQTCWADQRPMEQVRKAMEHSQCYGVYLEDARKLVGFARVISDCSATYYLCDVIIDETAEKP